MATCRCGKIDDYDDPIIINSTMHEGFDVLDGFCGPIMSHTIRNQDQLIIRLEKRIVAARKLITEQASQIKQLKNNLLKNNNNGCSCARCIRLPI